MNGDHLTPQELQQTLAELTAFSAQPGVPEELRKAIHTLELSQVQLELHNRELEDSRCRYADLFDNAPVGYLTTDEHGTVVTANVTAVRMLGREQTGIVGSRLAGFVTDPDAFDEHMERARADEGKVTSEFWLVTPMGYTLPVQVVTKKAAVPGFREGGVEFRTTLTDLTDLRKAQDELDNVRHLLLQAMQSARLRVWSRDLKTGIIRMWSAGPPLAEEGRTEWQGTAEDTYAMVHPDDVARVRQIIEGAIADGTNFRAEMRVRNADGVYVWNEARGRVRKDAHGKPEFLEGVSLTIEDLRRSEELLQDVARFPRENPEPVLRCRQDGTLLYANPASEEVLRQTGSALGKPLPQLFFNAVREAFSSGHNQMLDARIGGRDLSFQVVPIRDLSYVNLYGRDVTAQRKAEEVMQRQADLIELSPDAMFVRTLDGHITFWSRGAERLYGYQKDEALGKTSRELLVTTLPESFESIVAKLRKGEHWSGELLHRRRDGTFLTVQSRWLLRPGSGEYPDEIFESNVDITERKRMEEDLRHSEERFRMLIESSGEPVAILDDERRIASISQSGAQVLGWSRTFLAGKETGELIPSDERPLFERALDGFERSPGESLAIVMTRFTRQDGSRRWIEWELTPIHAGGRPRGFMTRLRDLGAYLPGSGGFHK